MDLGNSPAAIFCTNGAVEIELIAWMITLISTSEDKVSPIMTPAVIRLGKAGFNSRRTKLHPR